MLALDLQCVIVGRVSACARGQHCNGSLEQRSPSHQFKWVGCGVILNFRLS